MEKACETCVHKDKPSFSATRVECGFAMMNYEHMPFTNADRVRAMSDEELANKISGIESFALTCGGGWPPEKWLDWLRQEVDNG